MGHVLQCTKGKGAGTSSLDPALHHPAWLSSHAQARTMARYAARCMAGQVDELGSGFAFEVGWVQVHGRPPSRYPALLVDNRHCPGNLPPSLPQLFAHVTRFFGFPVALLGCFNAQHLADADQRRLVQEVKIVQTSGEGRQEETVKLEGPALGSLGAGQEEEPETEGPVKQRVMNKIEVLTRLTPGVEYVKVVVVDGRVKGAMLVGEGTEMAETFENLILNQIDVSPYGVDLLSPDVDLDDYFD